MCGIIAISGSEDVASMALAGLKKLEYRGYDSFGFALETSGALAVSKSLEPMDEFVEQLPASQSVIGHTRWATHGGVTIENCHPHLSSESGFALAHNGIVENYQSLMSEQKAEEGRGTSDTQLIVKLLTGSLKKADRLSALVETLSLLEGRNSILVIFEDGQIFGVRQGSPLMIGRNDGCAFIGSDVLSFGDWATHCCSLEDGEIVRLKGTDIEKFKFSGETVSCSWEQVEYGHSSEELHGYAHYMLKEIMEQWRTVSAQKIFDEGEFNNFLQRARAARRIFVTGAGGAYFTSKQISWLLRNMAGLDVIDVPAYEFESIVSLMGDQDIVLAISQSGETADTLDALQISQAKGLYAVCLVNMPFSTLTRLCDSTFYNRCGPEICVLSTKSATSQITFGYLLAGALNGDFPCTLSQVDEMSHELSLYFDYSNYVHTDNVHTDNVHSDNVRSDNVRSDNVRSDNVRSDKHHSNLPVFEELASILGQKESLFVLGRREFYATAMIAALNIKEASYIHAEAFAAGELKHGVIALIEEGTPVIVYAGKDDNYMLNVCAELRSRGAFILGIAAEDNALFHRFLPLPGAHLGPLVTASSIIPGQLLAYHLSVLRGHNPDKPRNLAKSVTVR